MSSCEAERRPTITAYVGSGGKTGSIRLRAEALRAEGRRVLVTTTTHILPEPGCVTGGDPEPILRALRERGLVWAGTPAAEGKLGALPEACFRACCREADEVLVEADGSRQLPLKYPAPHEPVIPAGTARIVVVAGLRGLGQPVCEVCHRPELVCRCLGITEDTPIGAEHVARLLEEGYLRRLERDRPDAELRVLLCGQDTEARRAAALKIGALLRAERPGLRMGDGR